MKLGKHISGRARWALKWAKITEQYRKQLPDYPSTSVIKPTRVPDPPLLSLTASEPERVVQCAYAFRMVRDHLYPDCDCRTRVIKKTGKPKPHRACLAFQSLDPKELLQDEDYAELVFGAPLLAKYRIAPVAWCMFSTEVWMKYVAGKYKSAFEPPTPKWVFSENRINERREDWFSWRESAWKGGHVKLAPQHRKLLMRYERMRHAILVHPEELTQQVVVRLVKRHCPLDDYDVLAAEARSWYAKESARLHKALQREQWIWT